MRSSRHSKVYKPHSLQTTQDTWLPSPKHTGAVLSGLVVSVVDCTPIGRRFESASCQRILPPPPVVHDWVLKGLGMSSHVCATAHGHIKDPVPPIEKSRALCHGGRFPPSFIHQVMKMALDADWA